MTGIVDTPGATAPGAAAPDVHAGPSASAAPARVVSPPPAPKPPLSRLAVWGFILTFSSILIVPLLAMVALVPHAAVDADPDPGPLAMILPILPLAMVLAGLILSIAGWVRVARSDGRLRGLGYAITGTVLAVPILLAMLSMTLLFVRAEPVEDGPMGRVRASSPVLVQKAEAAPGRADAARGAEAYAQVDGLWQELQGMEKVTPSDLHRLLFHPVDAARLQDARGEDLPRLHGAGLLWTRPSGKRGPGGWSTTRSDRSPWTAIPGPPRRCSRTGTTPTSSRS